MATPSCWRCLLLRPSTALAAPARVAAAVAAKPPGLAPTTKATSAPFSTSAPLNAAGDRAGNPNHSIKKAQTFRMKKKAVKPPAKSPLPGERKAFRKRIQLSNNNALPVEGLEPLNGRGLTEDASVATIRALPDDLVDQLRAVEAFKPTQNWGLFRAPHVLVRAETVELCRSMQQAAENKETLRLVINGDKISGKSTLLLQALSKAFLDDWVVFHIPEAQELTTACTEYAPIPGTQPTQYMQHVYAFKMLRRLLKTSEKVLRKITMLRKHDDVSTDLVTHSSSLADLVSSAREADQAWPVLRALWAELLTPAPDRRPILFSLDGLGHIMRTSDYRSPAFELIHSHDLSLIRRFIDALSGGATAAPDQPPPPPFPAGGAVLAATTLGNSPKSFSMELALARLEAAKRGEAPPAKDPYSRAYDERVEAALADVGLLRLGALTRTEARVAMEYWAASGLLRAAVDEKKVVDVLSVSGGGIIGEVERALLLSMRI
ncbi:hypothetical protein GGTG_05410 [Gaeumannomyces tritici R3-111a-1]|uniref:Small ribosomal subunit protein mS29 n=1 Tax=Gaeumannomyces tritici (strain R3-111a-1) TaxID=644352 RepID=J3NVU8_GAET3|nr:hypothetical protein GGTG_05410 [Gaeumannomyces tritici R3-111a-1]EJT75477.1 hypothetical protein GGTG_05410 [Gaeumannomyces tritici R3-111a-1]